MDIPAPKPSQVIRYAYLWADEHDAGRDEGTNHPRVAVVPITHSPPPPRAIDALEIPANIKRHLGLDDARSWVVLTELNMFTWPGPDLRPTGDRDSSTVAFGYLPAGFFRPSATVWPPTFAPIACAGYRARSKTSPWEPILGANLGSSVESRLAVSL